MAPLRDLFDPAVDVQRFVLNAGETFSTPRIGPRNIKVDNRTQPYSTTSPELGFDGIFYAGSWFFPQSRRQPTPYTIQFHSPYELSSVKNFQFSLVDLEYVTFSIIPQRKTIDETMFGMTPSE